MTHSLRFKAGAAITIVCCAALGMAGWTMTNLVETNLKKQAVHNAELEANVAVEQVDERLAYMQQAYYGITFDSSLERMLGDGENVGLREELPEKLETLLMTSNYNVYSIYVKDLNTGDVYSTEQQNWDRGGKWTELSEETLKRHQLIVQKGFYGDSPLVLSLVGQMRRNYWDEPLAWVSVNTQIYEFHEILSQQSVYNDTLTFLATAQGELLADGRTKVPSEAICLAMDAPQGSIVSWDGTEYIVVGAKTEKYNLEYRQLIPEREVFAEIYSLRIVLFTILLGLSAIIFIALYKLLDYVTAPIYELSDVVHSYRQRGGNGKWTGSFKTTRKDEFAYLYQSLDEMTTRIDDLINRDYKSQLYKKETQLRAYRNGMNPHFLYNILDSIFWTMKFKDYTKAERMLQDFSSFLHHVLHESKEFVSLAEQAEELRAFCTLSSFLKDDTIAFSIEFPAEPWQYTIPSFLLQPLAENCFKHAFKEGAEGMVSIKGCLTEHALVFSVVDNGTGMSQETCALLRETLDRYDINQSTEHFGMASVHQRLLLYYGAEHGLQITSELGLGTTVSFSIPLDSLEKFPLAQIE
ncbi:MAG: histidine kinase [Ruthenibacterium sp.]